MQGHQVGTAEGVDLGDVLVHFAHLGLEGFIVHIAPITRLTVGFVIMLGGSGAR